MTLLLLLQLTVTLGVTSPAPGLAHLPSIRLPASQPACRSRCCAIAACSPKAQHCGEQYADTP